jgi:hypothetical protein
MINTDIENIEYFKRATIQFIELIEENSNIKYCQMDPNALRKNDIHGRSGNNREIMEASFGAFIVIGIEYWRPGNLDSEIKKFQESEQKVSLMIPIFSPWEWMMLEWRLID